MKYFLNLTILFLLGFLVNCSSSNSKKNDENTVDDPEDQNTTVFFSNVINIIAINCADCHGLPVNNGAPMSLVTYEDIAESANLINIRINLPESDPLSMPQNRPSLTQADKDTIANWIAAGMPNN
jgi:uncharacterized membrane protein